MLQRVSPKLYYSFQTFIHSLHCWKLPENALSSENELFVPLRILPEWNHFRASCSNHSVHHSSVLILNKTKGFSFVTFRSNFTLKSRPHTLLKHRSWLSLCFSNFLCSDYLTACLFLLEPAKLRYHLRNGPLIINRQLLTEIRKPCTIELHFCLFSFAPTVLIRQILSYCLRRTVCRFGTQPKYQLVYHARRSINCLVNYCSSAFRFNREKMIAGVNGTCPIFRDCVACRCPRNSHIMLIRYVRHKRILKI